MNAARRNVVLLACSQAAMLTTIVMSMAVAAILGAALAPDKGLATLPIAAMVVGTAIASLPAFAARHADLLADAPADRERIRSEKVDIEFLDYDWALNDAR